MQKYLTAVTESLFHFSLLSLLLNSMPQFLSEVMYADFLILPVSLLYTL